jgi:hypothetical protein
MTQNQITLVSLQETLKRLPDYGPAADFLPLFRDICAFMRGNDDEGVTLLVMLFDLSLRQWETGEYLEPSVRVDLDELLPTIWDAESVDSTRKMVTVTLCLALQNTWRHMQRRMETISNPKVRIKLLEAFEQYRRGPLDPWRDY